MRPSGGCHLVAAKNMLGGLGTRVDLEKALSDGGDLEEELSERGEYTLS